MPGIGPAAASRLLQQMERSLDCTEALQAFKPPSAASEAWPAFAELFSLLRRNAAGWPAELDLACQWYAPHLERNYDDAAIRQLDLIQLAQIAASYPSRERFLTELTLDPPDATSDEAGPPLQDEDYLILSTIHSAKGQEWKSVYVLNTVDGCIPADLAVGSSQEIEEERRLLYVAMTRAKDHLHLMVPQRFFVQQQRANGDRHVYAQRTRFIPSAILGKFDNCYWPSQRTQAGVKNTTPRQPIDLKAKLARHVELISSQFIRFEGVCRNRSDGGSGGVMADGDHVIPRSFRLIARYQFASADLRKVEESQRDSIPFNRAFVVGR